MGKFLFGLAFISLLSSPLLAGDKVIIISPHRKSIQQEYLPAFKAHYQKKYKTEIQVDWIDQGGTSDDIRYVRAKYAKNPKSCGIDVFWGGGTTTFVELNNDKFLAPFPLPAELKPQIPMMVGGVPLYDQTGTWYASAMSSFGIFYNKKVLMFEDLKVPTLWAHLGAPKFYNNITVADPRRSGSATAMNLIVLQSLGWDKGWEMLTTIAGNAKQFTHSSSAPIKAVVSGDVAATMAIDFYANAKISDLGAKNLGFALPEGQTVMDPDPIAILKGAPNRVPAMRFLEFVLSARGQKILILPKGVENGPKLTSLGRMAINKAAYEETKGIRKTDVNPFTMSNFLKMELEKSSKMQRVFIDLIGAIHIDTHRELRKAWKKIIKTGMKAKDLALLSKPPVTEAELLSLADKWGDNVYRNKVINSWVKYAQEKYHKLSK